MGYLLGSRIIPREPAKPSLKIPALPFSVSSYSYLKKSIFAFCSTCSIVRTQGEVDCFVFSSQEGFSRGDLSS